jgi:hypothetical protein
LLLNELGVAVQRELGIREVGFVLFELGLCDRKVRYALIDDGLIGARVDLGADLPRFHWRVIVTIKLLDDTGIVCPDNDRELRVDRTCSRHFAGDCPRITVTVV